MFAILLISLGILSRLIPHLSQFTAILAVAMFGGMYLTRWQAIIVPMVLMLVTDLILGFHDTMPYTYGSMLAITTIGIYLKDHKSTMNVFSGSVFASLLFFVVTNFGAYLSLYPHTWAGLQECYMLAVPFFRSTVLSTIGYSLVLYASYEWLYHRVQGSALARLL